MMRRAAPASARAQRVFPATHFLKDIQNEVMAMMVTPF